jgi:hypothetical protein
MKWVGKHGKQCENKCELACGNWTSLLTQSNFCVMFLFIDWHSYKYQRAYLAIFGKSAKIGTNTYAHNCFYEVIFVLIRGILLLALVRVITHIYFWCSSNSETPTGPSLGSQQQSRCDVYTANATRYKLNVKKIMFDFSCNYRHIPCTRDNNVFHVQGITTTMFLFIFFGDLKCN